MVALQLNKHPEKTAFILKLREAKQAKRKWCDHVCNQNKKPNNYYLKQKVNFVALLFHSRCIIHYFLCPGNHPTRRYAQWWRGDQWLDFGRWSLSKGLENLVRFKVLQKTEDKKFVPGLVWKMVTSTMKILAPRLFS